MTRLIPLLAVSWLGAGCGATTPAVSRAASSAELSEEEARRVIDAYENRRALRAATASDPLRNPKSLDDVVEILKLDRVDLFADGVKYATTQQGPKALALRAQMELAWGEAQLILADLLGKSTTRLRAEARTMETRAAAGGTHSADEQKELSSLRDTVRDIEGIEAAMHRVGTKHIEGGITLARLVIDQAPNDYHGYRVAADYYRLREDWAGFDSMVKKLEQANPNSNGLLFARGMEALMRHGDRTKADKLFREALERDPKFTRAQVQLLLAQAQTGDAWDELQKLKAISPQHQIVMWVGPAISSAHDRMLAQQRRMQQRIDTQAQSAPMR
jgi:hypothetical protein